LLKERTEIHVVVLREHQVRWKLLHHLC
jgi:hypothetical protein